MHGWPGRRRACVRSARFICSLAFVLAFIALGI
jgi:hypothetical protein